MDNAVSLINVSKKFRLYNAPHDRLIEVFHPFKKKYHREFWALRDINLEIPKGTTLGIIGRNGSGKSTLLQIICSVLKPTSGDVSINGRVSALLELGADFHPDFTGRENVIQKGIRMGFTEKEMLSKIPEIEEFADIGEFIDQPVKIYSSGMFLRLAFSTAINVDPDILVVDEALAVGDAKFQHKCYQKFTEFQEKGKTIIFVTHNMEAVVRHCEKALILDYGKMLDIGNPNNITNRYLDILFSKNDGKIDTHPSLIMENYKNFNIVYYKNKYHAVSLEAGDLDLTNNDVEISNRLIKEKKYFMGDTFEEVSEFIDYSGTKVDDNTLENKKLIDYSNSLSDDSVLENKELSFFIKNKNLSDNCTNRRSYNKNEYRYGNRKAEIIDYMTICDGLADPFIIKSGSEFDIFFKIKYNLPVKNPMCGMVIKTTDGMLVYGTNTLISRFMFNQVSGREIVIIRFRMKISLNSGDYFIDVGCAEIDKGESLPLDRRYGLVHLNIIVDEEFTGLVNLSGKIKEIGRIKF